MPDHRNELALRGGVIFGGEMNPYGDVGETSTSWIGLADWNVILLPYFTIGAHAQLTHASYEFDHVKNAADVTVFHPGVSAKVRFAPTDDVTIRAGLTMGPNFTIFSGKNIDASGVGLNTAGTAELAFRVAKAIALSAQVSFMSQVAGSVKIDGQSDSAKLAYPPHLFVAFGPEFLL